MPTINDATVVASAYDTSGNGGRKLVKLSNGWLVAGVLRPGSGRRIDFYVDKEDGNGFVLLAYVLTSADTSYFSLSSSGNFIHCLVVDGGIARPYSISFNATTATGDLSANKNYIGTTDNSSYGSGATTVVNDAGTEIHASWCAKTTTYANSFNIRYAKGTINADGSVTWGAVQQLSTYNTSGADNTDPSIVIVNGNPIVYHVADNGPSYYITSRRFDGTSWVETVVYNGGSYTQSSPSAIFVPQSVNGLANGRIWVAWHGLENGHTYYSARIAYSDDGGVTWSTQQRIAGGGAGRLNVTLTASKTGEIFAVYSRSTTEVRYIKSNTSGVFTAKIADDDTKLADGQFPSTLFDLSLNFTSPLFIYKASDKVGFYGTWTTFVPLSDVSLPFPNNDRKKENLETLRTKVNEFRVANGLSNYIWTDPVIIAKITPLKAVHWNEIQTAINEVYSIVGQTISSPEVQQKVSETIVAKDRRFTPRNLGDRMNFIIRALRNQ